MSLRFYNHSGGCCGIKTIAGFRTSPTQTHPEMSSIEHTVNVSAQALYFYKQARPAESGVDRLNAYLEFFDKHRSDGCIEVTLIDSQLTGWRPVLEGAGFVVVTRFLNSNSNNYVTVFHRVTKNTKPQKRTISK